MGGACSMNAFASVDIRESNALSFTTANDHGCSLTALVSCPGDFVIGAPPPTARLTLDLADWLGLSRVDYCFHYDRDSSLVLVEELVVDVGPELGENVADSVVEKLRQPPETV